MAFNAELFKDAWPNVFSHARGSCTWIEPFILHDLTSKLNGIGRIRVVHRSVGIDGEKYDLSAYQVDVGETDTFFVTDSAQHDLAGTLCHFYDGFTQAKVLRYFYGRVFFEAQSNPVKRLLELGYSAPTIPGVAVIVLIDLLRKLDITVSEAFLENVEGMATWVEENYPQYSNVSWPTMGK